EQREDHDEEERHTALCRGGGDRQHADLAGGIEAQTKEEANRIHHPTALYGLEERAEEARQEAALVEELLDRRFVVSSAASDLAKGLDDVEQDDEVERGDKVEERRGDAGADQAAHCLEARQICLHKE